MPGDEYARNGKNGAHTANVRVAHFRQVVPPTQVRHNTQVRCNGRAQYGGKTCLCPGTQTSDTMPASHGWQGQTRQNMMTAHAAAGVKPAAGTATGTTEGMCPRACPWPARDACTNVRQEHRPDDTCMTDELSQHADFTHLDVHKSLHNYHYGTNPGLWCAGGDLPPPCCLPVASFMYWLRVSVAYIGPSAAARFRPPD